MCVCVCAYGGVHITFSVVLVSNGAVKCYCFGCMNIFCIAQLQLGSLKTTRITQGHQDLA